MFQTEELQGLLSQALATPEGTQRGFGPSPQRQSLRQVSLQEPDPCCYFAV